MTAITGKTYPIRHELRDLGGTWDAAKQCWFVPDDRADEAKGLLEVGRARANVSRRYNPSLERVGGGRGYVGTDRRGRAHFRTPCRCEDYPCCGH